jgi:hypothetical protein
MENSENSSVYRIAATPDAEYMLNYWEYSTDNGGTWCAESERIVNDSEDSATVTTVTITENRLYRAVFKPWRFLLSESASLISTGSAIELIPSTASSWMSRAVGMKNQSITTLPASESIRFGQSAGLFFKIGWPCTIPNRKYGKVTIRLYAGDATEDADAQPIHTVYNTYNPVTDFNAGDQASDFDAWPARPFAVYVPSIPDADGITVEIVLPFSDGSASDKNIRAYYPLTTIIRDTSVADREAALSVLDEAYDSYMAHAVYDDPATSDVDESEYLKYKALLKHAYEAGRQAVVDAESSEAIVAAADLVLAGLENIVAGTDDTDNVYDDYIETVFRIFKVLPPTLVRVPDGITQMEAMAGALEQTYPEGNPMGTWYIDKVGGFINDIGVDPDKELSGYVDTYQGFDKYMIYHVNGFYADIGAGGWQVSDKEVFTWDNNTASRPVEFATASISGADSNAAGLWASAVALDELGAEANYLALNGKTLDEVKTQYPAFASRLDWSLPPAFISNEQVAATLASCGALTASPLSPLAEVTAARAAYNALPGLRGSAISKYYFQYFEPYKTAYGKLIAAESAHDIITLPDVTADVALAGSLEHIKATTANPTVKSEGGEWAVLALARGGALTDEVRDAYLTNLDTTLAAIVAGASVTDKERITLALSSLGRDASAYKGVSGSNATVDLTAAYRAYDEDALLNAKIYALLALDSKPYAGKSEDYVGALLETALDGGGWSFFGAAADVDMTAMALQALAPHYDGMDGVKAACDKALTWLKTRQDGATGGFKGWNGEVSTESTAQVIVALTALGIDPAGAAWTTATDGSPLTALLAHYNAEGGWFGSSDNAAKNVMATEQGAYALVAYDRFVNDRPALYDMYDAFGSARATVTFRLIGDTAHGPTDAPQYHDWIKQRRVRLTGTAPFTVYDAFMKALREAGLAQSGADAGHVKSITKNGLTLAESGEGESYSGWKYSINGADSTVGLKLQNIKNGDVIVWRYIAADIPAWTQSLTHESTNITVEAGTGVIPSGAKLDVAPIAPGTARHDGARSALADVGTNLLLYDIALLDAASRQIQPNGEVRVSLPLPAGMAPDRIEVYRIEDSGARIQLRSELSSGKLAFYTNHFSLYAIVERAIAQKQEQTEEIKEEIKTEVLSLSDVKLTIADKQWTGRNVTSGLVVTATYGSPAKTIKLAPADYTLVKAGKWYKAIGKAKITVKARGMKYTGDKTVTFNIVPKKVKLTKLAAGKKYVKATWKKAAAAQKITGYQIRYKVKTAAKWSSAKNVPGGKPAYKIGKMKKGKRYYVQVRAYTKAGKARYYGPWSATALSKAVK